MQKSKKRDQVAASKRKARDPEVCCTQLSLTVAFRGGEALLPLALLALVLLALVLLALVLLALDGFFGLLAGVLDVLAPALDGLARGHASKTDEDEADDSFLDVALHDMLLSVRRI
jgi:hypothetical protein